MGGIDPILCAQDIPREMRIIGSELEGKKNNRDDGNQLEGTPVLSSAFAGG